MTEDKDLREKQSAADAAADEAVNKNTESEAASDAASKTDNDDTAKSAADASSETKSAEETDKTETAADNGTEAADAESSTADSADDSAKPDKKDKQIEELNDKYKRLFAEFDNFRKRTEAEKTGMFAEGERTVLLKVLPLIDNFERALDSIPEEQKGTALAEGIDKTYKAFVAQLTELGVTPIEAKGKSFDANLHNAVMHVEDEEADENVVVEEFQKGYMFKDKVLRYSMVKVAN